MKLTLTVFYADLWKMKFFHEQKFTTNYDQRLVSFFPILEDIYILYLLKIKIGHGTRKSKKEHNFLPS